VTVEKSSTHHTTADDAGLADVPIYPSIPSNYGNGSTVTILNGIENEMATNAYTDVFGFTTGAFPGQSVAVTTSLSTDKKTMTITVAETVAADAVVADNVNSAGTDITGETVDMGGFFSDLSHVSVASRDATAGTIPSFFINYEDIQDTNYNSWAKTDEYDNYDDGRSPLLVGVDTIGPLLQQRNTGTGSDNSTNTFLYDVTDQVSFSLAAAHGSHYLTTDDDVIYTGAIDSTTANTNTSQTGGNDIAFTSLGTGTDNLSDYPLFFFWHYNSATPATRNANSDNITAARAVLKLSGVSKLDTSDTQAYMYTPHARDTDQGDPTAGANNKISFSRGDGSADDCTTTEEEVDAYIHATPRVSGIRVSASTTSYGTSNPATGALSSQSDNSTSGVYVLTNASDVLNVDADDNVNYLTDAGLSALIVGIPAYGGEGWDSAEDALVMEDVFVDGVPYTLHFKIPAAATADMTDTTYKFAETDNLPVMKVYRKVTLASVNLMPSGNGDMCSPRNVQTGQLVSDDYDPDGLVFSFREQLAGSPTITWYSGSDLDEPTTAANDSTNGVTTDFTGEKVVLDNATATVRLGDSTEITNSFIGHDSQFTVTVADVDENSTSYTVTLRLGHGAQSSTKGITNTGAIDATPDGAIATAHDATDTVGAAVVVDPILNIIGKVSDQHVTATVDSSGGNHTAVE
jgi:hypothetical protein